MISKLYSSYESNVHEDIYKDMRTQIENKKKENSQSEDEFQPNAYEALTHKDYRKATWMSSFLTIA